MRGVAAYTANPLMRGLADVLGSTPRPISAMPSITSKSAARCGRGTRSIRHSVDAWGKIVLLGGWYGILAAILFDDRRFEIGEIASYDIDPAVGAVPPRR